MSKTVTTISSTIGAIVGAVITHIIMPVYEMPQSIMQMQYMPSLDRMGEIHAEYGKVVMGNGTIAIAVVGATLGLGSGLCGQTKSRWIRALAGCLLGAGGGALGGWVGGWLDWNIVANLGRLTILGYEIDPMFHATLIQCAVWMIVGSSIGLAIAAIDGISHGLLGGLLTGVTYSVIGSFAFPGTNQLSIVPPSLLEQIVWSGWAGIVLAVAISLSKSKLKGQPAENDKSAPAS